MEKRVHTIVLGSVQGVGYRWFVQQTAKALGLKGFVRNLVDGTVEIEAQGNQHSIEEFLRKVRIGPLGAYVSNVKIREKEIEFDSMSFEIRH
jgi:acylphosphatase